MWRARSPPIPFRDKLIGNIEPRGVFHTGREEQWKANFKGIPFLKGYELPEDWHPDIILSSPDCGSCSVMRLSKSKTLGDPKVIKYTTSISSNSILRTCSLSYRKPTKIAIPHF